VLIPMYKSFFVLPVLHNSQVLPCIILGVVSLTSQMLFLDLL
jgi:hypothetical protein